MAASSDAAQQGACADVWVCLDFEATCDEGNPPLVRKDEAELIEFAFAVYDARRDEITHIKQCYCKNVRTPLTEFCTRLTGITPAQLEEAGSLEEALGALTALLETEEFAGRSVCAVTHGSWDLESLLPLNCKAVGLEVPLTLQTYVDLRATVQKYFSGQRVQAGTLTEICAALGIKMAGRLHSGRDDAVMVAMGVQALLKRSASIIPIELAPENLSFRAGEEQRLCLDGLSFTIVASDITDWLEGLGYTVAPSGLRMVLEGRGRPSGRAVVDFGSHESAAAALSDFEGGKRMRVRGVERQVLLRPLRDSEVSVAPAALIAFPTDVARVDSLRGAPPPRAGDWTCPACSYTVFARNSTCRRCGAKKPAS